MSLRHAPIRHGAAAPGRSLRRALALGLFLPALLAGCGNGAEPPAPAGTTAPAPDGVRRIELPRPLPQPDLTLTGVSGRPVNLAEATRGRLALVFFGYTNCPDVCPTTMADVAAALRRLTPGQRARVAVVFVSSDPWRDTPRAVRSWLASFDRSFIGMTGDFDRTRAAARTLGIGLERPQVREGGYEVTHGGQLVVFGTDRRARVIYPSGVSARDLAADLPGLLERDGRPGGAS
ncbi:SCO family protein [Actinomadura kijaniata]|uniref:SCO family protein n=1 Tax=Actinomadura kijaniata TaxID=46161 RepID=UPI003F1A8097